MIRRFLSMVLLPLLSASASAQLSPEKGLAAMKPAEGLQVELFAAEPMVINPTSIDVDDKGRVWVSEAVNYRRKNFNRPILREAGDRIQVLIDEKGDGKATKAVTFYQGKEIYGPLSVCVIPTGKGYRVLVAQSPDILEFTCKDSSNPVADGPPKKFLTGFGGFDHDHGVHGLHLGPDGKLYFTVGDAGVNGLQSSDGKGKKYVSNATDIQKGTVWRCDLDGKNLELIAHNFRNNYECCVDSFGEIWLSDNDDDGNQQTRICHVMPGGNYGYGPRGPGQSHWHEEQPGIVHKTLRTGFGSPTGIQFYEGSLLGKKYTGTLLHCDAGPREVRAFTRKPKGAGYELDKEVILTSSDNFFRPSDVCTAPDGSIFVADWYDRGVGGHGMGDPNDGRIYRLTPKGHKGYKVPEVKVSESDPESVGIAIGSANLCVRSSAQQLLARFDKPTLMNALESLRGDLSMARALLTYNHSEPHADDLFLARNLKESQDNRFKSVIVRGLSTWLTTADNETRTKYFSAVTSQDTALNRELLLLLARCKVDEVSINAFYSAAKFYDGQDIFYRAALNIACGTDQERRDKILADFEKHFPTLDDKTLDLVWELRPKAYIAKLDGKLFDDNVRAGPIRRVMEIIASSDDTANGLKLLKYYTNPNADQFARRHAFDLFKQYLPGKWAKLKEDPAVLEFITKALKPKNKFNASDVEDRRNAIELAGVVQNPKMVRQLSTIAEKADDPDRVTAIIALGGYRSADAAESLESLANSERVGSYAIESLGKMQTAESLAALEKIFENSAQSEFNRKAALNALAGSRNGTQWLLKLHETKKFPEGLIADAGRLLRNSPFQGERNKAMLLFPAPGKLDPKKLPSIAELAKRVGNADNGKAVMAKSLTSEVQCLKCHMVRGQGGSIGPDLSMIGKKGPKESLYESLFTPSKAIADQYLSWKVDSEDGQSVTGLLVGETETTLTIRDANGKDYQFPVKGTERKKQLTSIMPEGLVATLTEDELVDVVEYLSQLKTPSLTPESWQIAGPFQQKIDDNFAGLDVSKWRSVKGSPTGYLDLAAFHGDKGRNSVSLMTRTIESPVDQEATILLGTDDGCRLFVNGVKVFGHDKAVAATPEADSVTVKLKKGSNVILLKVSNGDNPHGFYFTIVSKDELKLAK